MSYHISDPHEVWKHELPPADGTVLELKLPAEAKVIQFGVQNGVFCIWEVHPIRNREALLESQFWLTGTGHEIPGWLLILGHIGTVQQGPFVWHLFEVSNQLSNMGPR